MVERRKHKRYSMPRGTFVILRNKFDPLRNHTNMSIGEIAMVLYKSEPEAMGQVTNLSAGGIAFDGKVIGSPDAGKVQLDLLMTEQGIYVHNIPYAVVPVKTKGKTKKKTPAFRTNALRFKRLDAEKRGQLRELLAHRVG
ncbi:MAG: PilZ domain-containing protein [Desulfobacteraceae bacterium]|nr:PilZ domain-containing protein [Desulfobacteraceae bacterium]